MLRLYPTGADATHAVWFDLVDPNPEERAQVKAATGLTVPTLAEVSEIESSSRLNRIGDALYLSTPAITRGADGIPQITAVGLVLTPRHFLTVRFADLAAFRIVAERLGPEEGSAEAFVALLEAIVDRLADVLEQVRTRLDEVSGRAFQPKGSARRRAIDNALQRALRAIGGIGDHISNIREVLLGVARIVPYTSQNAASWLSAHLVSRLETLAGDITSLRDYNGHLESKAQFLLDATLGFINIEQNNIFRVLTVFSIVGIPPTLLAGIYGMNFKNMPELSWSFGYEFGWIVIIASALIPFALFRWRGWI